MGIRQTMTRLGVAAVALTLTVGLVACGASADDPNLGRYAGYAINVTGDERPIEETYGNGENYLELKAGNNATMSLDGDAVDGTWKLEGETFTFTASEDGETYESVGTLRDGVITIDYFGFGIRLTFVREGAQEPFEVVPTTDADDAEEQDATEDEANVDDEVPDGLSNDVGTGTDVDGQDTTDGAGDQDALDGTDAQTDEVGDEIPDGLANDTGSETDAGA